MRDVGVRIPPRQHRISPQIACLDESIGNTVFIKWKEGNTAHQRDYANSEARYGAARRGVAREEYSVRYLFFPPSSSER